MFRSTDKHFLVRDTTIQNSAVCVSESIGIHLTQFEQKKRNVNFRHGSAELYVCTHPFSRKFHVVSLRDALLAITPFACSYLLNSITSVSIIPSIDRRPPTEKNDIDPTKAFRQLRNRSSKRERVRMGKFAAVVA